MARTHGQAFLVIGAALVACAVATPQGTTVPIPDGAGGIGFDDLRYSPQLHRVLAPAGRTGALALVDPDSLAVTTIADFRASPTWTGGHDDGPTSVDEGAGLLFVTDRTAGKLFAVDPTTAKIVASASVASTPDYVRWVQATGEVWITEPDSSQLEIFAFSATQAGQGGQGTAGPTLASVATIAFANGPESLVVDQAAGRAYAHRWQNTSVVLDVRARAVVAEWPNGCTTASRGLALDAARGFFMAGCSDGTLSVLDIAQDGKMVSSIAEGSDVDVIGYSPTLGHVYQAGSGCSCLVILGVSGAGQVTLLGQLDAPATTHCATADDRGHAWVCDPQGGQLFRITDPYPASL
jgi:hypothetical protein